MHITCLKLYPYGWLVSALHLHFLAADFGIISTSGIITDAILRDVNILDTKHAGINLLRQADMLTKGWFRWEGGLIAGQSSTDVCTACATLSDPGCPPKFSVQSFNTEQPFSPAVGMQSAQFALTFTPGPERKPYDAPMSYSVIHVSEQR